MKISGKYFEYNSINSAYYGLRVLHIDTEEIIKSCGDISYKTTFNKATNEIVINGIDKSESKFDEPIELISEEVIPDNQVREIKNWLFNHQDFKKLYEDLSEDDTQERINKEIKRSYSKCVFYNPEDIIFADGLHGWKCKMMTSSGMDIQEDISQTFTDFTSDITISVDTDIEDYTYPQMVVVISSGDATPLSIINTSDSDREFKVDDVTAQSTLYIDNQIGTIIDSSDNSLYDNLANQRFLRLVPGDNVLTVTGNVTSIKFTWHNMRWFR